MNCLLNRQPPENANATPRRKRRRHPLPLLALLVLAVAAGCGGPQRRAGAPARMPSDPDRIWRPDPVEARIHPATRFVQEGDRAFLQLGVELVDGMRDPVKAPGILRCRLLTDPGDGPRSGLRGGQVAGTAPAPRGSLLYGWETRIATLEEQERAWDPVARCYLVELALESFDVASRPCRVRVEFEPERGPVLSADAAMQTLP